MKSFLVASIVCLIAQVSQAKVRLEVQPLSLQSQQSEVIGIKTSQRTGQKKAIVFTGHAAQQVAQAAGKQLDPTQEMIVMTGSEADQLVQQGSEPVYRSRNYNVGSLVFITATAFATAGMQLALGAIAAGVGVAWVGIAIGVTAAKVAVYAALVGLALPFIVVATAGVLFVKAMTRNTYRSNRYVYGTNRHVCRIRDYFSFGRLNCSRY